MNPDQYQHYKAKHKELLELFENRKEVSEIIYHLKRVKFDDFKHKIYYNGNNIELIACYFPRSQIIWKKPQ